MISVCIPVYNYAVGSLVQHVHKQLTEVLIPFEIQILDDASTNAKVKTENQNLTQLSYVSYHELKENLGNRDIRHALAERARYDWLLFLDADTLPANDNFISKYLDQISQKIDGVCGGIVYEKLENPNHIFRWKYGVQKETFTQDKKPKISEWKGANYLIKKNVFLSFTPILLPKKYGFEDALFGIQLVEKGHHLIFIDNPVIHKGLEDANIFLSKFNQSIENALFLAKNHSEYAKELNLIKIFNKIENYNLTKVVSFLFKNTKPLIIRNLTGKNPNITLFQIYKIGYLCELASSKMARSSAS